MEDTLTLDKFHEECGVIGIWNHSEAANIAYLGLYSQQHRGQEGAGVVSLQGTQFQAHRGLGLVAEVFSDYDFSQLPGKAALGHNRYTTAGSATKIANVQPFYAEISPGKVALAHNGNLINAEELKEQLIQDGAIFSSTSDTEIILHLMSRAPHNIPRAEVVISALKQVKGAYSLTILFDDRMFVVRDPNGFRPLAIGELDGGLIFASETCAFDLVGARYVRDVEPGELVEITGLRDMKSYFPFGMTKESPCIFEFVYFARPDSQVFGQNVYRIRKEMGIELAKENPVEADLVIPVPDSGVPAALGYSQASGIPFEYGLIRNHYVGRTFIEPKQSIRDFGVKIKLNPNTELLRGKSVIVVDDSIIRGTTSRKLVKMLRAAGAKQVHMRISAPPTIDPCYYGIDTPEKSELIASKKTIDEIAAYLEVDSLGYLSLDGLYRATGSANGKYCDACFSGNYPIGIGKNNRIVQTELFES